jgi:hypothetical protein
MPLLARLALLAVVMAVALAAFTWPSARLEPRELPVGVVGAVPAALADREAFDVRVLPSEAAARAAVRDRDVYGAIAGRTAYVATGAGPAVAAQLREAAAGARVVDLAPGTRADPRVATLPALALPLTLLGIVTALLAVLTAGSARERIAILAAGGVLAGLLGALFTQTWLDALPGSWLGLAGAIGLAVAAVAAAVTGLAAHLGRPGIGLGAVTMVLLGNPWSGISSAPELLPEPAATIGQLLPTGAAGGLIRSVAFFDGAAAGGHLLVLGAWAAAGLALIATAAVRRREGAPRVAPAGA